MKKVNPFVIVSMLLIVVIIVGIVLTFLIYFQKKDTSPTSKSLFKHVLAPKNNSLELLYEKVPGSRFHEPDATWWGYNQSKIVRYKDLVFMYVMENTDTDIKTLSDLVLYKKQENGSWEKGAQFQTSTPGNILIDSHGVLHVFIIEPKNVRINDTIGRLMHYSFPSAATGDLTTFVSETVIENTDHPQTLNPRIGASIASDDALAIAFGMTRNNPLYRYQSEHVYYKQPGENWQHLFTDNVFHDYYYPFVASTEDAFYLLTVQDDFTGAGNPNIYQQIMYFEFRNGTWTQSLLADHTGNELAQSRPRMVEQDDLFVDSLGNIHAVYKENTYPDNRFFTDHIHAVKKPDESEWQRQKLTLSTAINWVKLFEVEGTLYFFANSWDTSYLARLDTQVLTKLQIATPIGAYPYIARNSTNQSMAFIDILLLAADSETFTKGTNTNAYLKIPTSELAKLK